MKIEHCARCRMMIFRTKDNRYFCKNCGEIELTAENIFTEEVRRKVVKSLRS